MTGKAANIKVELFLKLTLLTADALRSKRFYTFLSLVFTVPSHTLPPPFTAPALPSP